MLIVVIYFYVKNGKRSDSFWWKLDYHIIFSGVNKYNRFQEEKDYTKFIEIIKDLKKEEEFEFYAYYLMSNYVHLLMKEKNRWYIINYEKNAKTICWLF